MNIEIAESVVSQLREAMLAKDRQAWARMFSNEATFTNPTLSNPIVGCEAITKAAESWPPFEMVWEWSVKEGPRIAVGWRERFILKNGKVSRWYRGIFTVVVNADGEIQHYDSVFNFWDVLSARLKFWEHHHP